MSSASSSTTGRVSEFASTFAYAAPNNAGFFATPSYAMTMFFSFVAGIFLTVAFSQTRAGNQAIASTTATVLQSAQSKYRGAKANWQVMEPTKMALVVRRDLKMGQGKVAAQCAHAAVGVLDRIYEETERIALAKESKKSLTSAFSLSSSSREGSVISEAERVLKTSSSSCENKKNANDDDTCTTTSDAESEEDLTKLEGHEEWMTWLTAWRSTGSAKVVLQVETEADLMAIVDAARKANLPTTYIRDAGRTQIAAGSKTVCAVGPAPVSMVDKVTGKLRLL